MDDEGTQLRENLTSIRIIEENAGRRDREGCEQRLQPAVGDRRLDERGGRLRESYALNRRSDQRRVVVRDERAGDNRLDRPVPVDERPGALRAGTQRMGILIDDLVTKGADEPYRMFTSRAEFRLHLRIDNADERLTPVGYRAGLVSSERWHAFERKQRQKTRLTEAMARERKDVWLKRPESTIGELLPWIRETVGEEPVQGLLATVETEIKYSGYIAQQERQMERVKDADRRTIPAEFAFTGIPGLSREIQEKLTRVRPGTLGQASRIPGVTPAAVAVLDVYLSLGRVS